MNTIHSHSPRGRRNAWGSIAVAALFLSLLVATIGKLQSVSRASASSDPVVAAAGDIACDPRDPNYMAGLGTSSACRGLYTSNLLLDGHFAAVLALGDNQYVCGAYSAYLASYDPTWGRVKSITEPVPGNHDYGCSLTAAPYFNYFGSVAGPAGKGWYSFNVGAWHLIALNSQCANIGRCGVGSPQYNWLQSDLATHPNYCTLAYWHIPLFSSSNLRSSATQPLWQLLYIRQADVILNGHAHMYERFAPQDPFGKADPARGIREFVAGTGGAYHTGIAAIAPNSQVRNTTTFGIFTLTLHATGYDWKFIPDSSGGFSDSGSNVCHSPDTTPPSAPADLTINSISPNQVNLSWTPSTDNVFVAGYRVYRDEMQIATTTNTS